MSAPKCTKVASLLEINASLCKPEEVLRLIRERGVLRLAGLPCSANPAWAADVLRAATPLLEELQLLAPTEELLGLAHTMPRLKRLFVEGFTHSAGTTPAAPAVVQALPALSARSRLETLCFKYGLASPPLSLLRAILRAHADSLKTLQLHSNAWGQGARVDVWIGECGLTSLKQLYISAKFIDVGAKEGEYWDKQTALKDSLNVVFNYNVDIIWYEKNCYGKYDYPLRELGF